MKALLALLAITASAGMLQANNLALGTDDNTQSPSQSQYMQGSQNPNMQSPYSKQNPSYMRDTQGYMDGSSMQDQYTPDQDQRYMQGSQGYLQEQNLQNDSQLNSKIKDSIKKAISNRYSNVSVNISNGTITLSGTVPTQADKDNVEKIANSMKGMLNVDNQITVQGQSSTSTSNY